MAVRQDITEDDMFFVGEDKELLFDCHEDVTGWTVRWTLTLERNSRRDPLMVAEVVRIAVVEVPTGPTNGLSVPITAEQTEGAEPRDGYWHELRRIDIGNNGVKSFGSVHLLAGAEES